MYIYMYIYIDYRYRYYPHSYATNDSIDFLDTWHGAYGALWSHDE